MGAITNVTTTLASAVADDATFTVSYPSGVTRQMLYGSTGGRMTVDNDASYAEGASGFTAAYGASSITITNTTGASLPIGSVINLSFGVAPYNGSYNLVLGEGINQAAGGPANPSWVELTATAAIPPTADLVELNHASVVIAATLDLTTVRNRTIIFKDTSATGTAAHTVTVSGGTLNGTATIATLNARDEMLVVHFDSAGRGQVVSNVGSVALS
jgi:hypothetical protein